MACIKCIRKETTTATIIAITTATTIATTTTITAIAITTATTITNFHSKEENTCTVV